MKRAGDRSKASIEALLTQDDAAALLNVSASNVDRAAKGRKTAAPARRPFCGECGRLNGT